MNDADVIGAVFLAALVITPLVVGLVVTFYMDRRRTRRRHGEQVEFRFWDEVDALAVQRYRKHEAMKQLRATARGARRQPERRSS
jgi:hypothetical protein